MTTTCTPVWWSRNSSKGGTETDHVPYCVHARSRLYASRRGQAVLVERTHGMPLVLTPDDVAGTIAAIDPPPHG